MNKRRINRQTLRQLKVKNDRKQKLRKLGVTTAASTLLLSSLAPTAVVLAETQATPEAPNTEQIVEAPTAEIPEIETPEVEIPALPDQELPEVEATPQPEEAPEPEAETLEKVAQGNLTSVTEESFAPRADNTAFASNEGNGTVNDPYLISSRTQLAAMSAELTAYYKLVADIDLSGSNWTPIGTSATPFTGSLTSEVDEDGAPIYEIQNLTITGATPRYKGLFGWINNATISDLNIVNANVSGTAQDVGILAGGAGSINGTGNVTNVNVSGTISGNTYVGGLIGNNYATISDCSSSVEVVGGAAIGGLIGQNYGTINNCSSSGKVNEDTFGFGQSGGLVGYNHGSINNSSSSSEVNGTVDVGGLIGYNTSTVTASSATGEVKGDINTGGLIGYNSSTGTIDSSSSSGEVIGSENYTGGLVGINYAAISNSSSSSDVSGVSNVGGLAGRSNTGAISESTTTGNVTGTGNYVGGLIGYNSISTVTDSSATGEVNGALNTGGLIGVNFSPITDSTATGEVNGTDSTGGLIGYNNSTVTASSATGEVNGALNTGGLIGRNANDSTITTSMSSGKVTGTGSYTGGLVGYNNAPISNSSSSSEVIGVADVGGLIGNSGTGEISTCRATGDVIGTGGNVGGLIGINFSAVTASSATGKVTGTHYTGGLLGYSAENEVSKSFATGNTTGTFNVGGFIGHGSKARISQVYATGDVTSTDVNPSFNFAPTGGLIGYSYETTIDSAYASGKVTGSDFVGGLLGQASGSLSNSVAIGDVENTSTTGEWGVMGHLVGGGILKNNYNPSEGMYEYELINNYRWDGQALEGDYSNEGIHVIEDTPDGNQHGGTVTARELRTAESFFENVETAWNGALDWDEAAWVWDEARHLPILRLDVEQPDTFPSFSIVHLADDSKTYDGEGRCLIQKHSSTLSTMRILTISTIS